MRIEFTAQGIHLPDLDLWLDPTGDCRRAWVSHAHRDRAGGLHREVYGTPETLELCKIRYANATSAPEFHPVGYGQSWELRGARLTAFPAAHILGAAQLLIEWRRERVLYTGDIKLRAPLCGRETELVQADRLIIESTFGLPIFHFLDREQARRRIVAFARGCLEEGCTPVFLAHELGRGQEVTHVLCEAGVPTAVDASVARFLPAYVSAGFAAPGWVVHDGEWEPERAVVAPSKALRGLTEQPRRARVAYVSGWAALDNARARMNAQELIAYSDHADFEELLELVRATRAREVDVVNGYSEAFARILTFGGWVARAPMRTTAREARD